MRWLIAVALAGCACPTKQAGTGTTGGTGSGSAVPPTLTGCDAITAKVQGLYRTEPTMTDELIADNTAMVMAVCRRDPGQVSACIASVTSVKDLEAQCLPKLDEEGSEGDVFIR